MPASRFIKITTRAIKASGLRIGKIGVLCYNKLILNPVRCCMSKLLVSKKGKPPVFLYAAGLLFIVLGIWLFAANGLAFSRDATSEFIAICAPIAMIIAGVVFLFTTRSYSKTYIIVYDDRIEGFGTCGKGGLGGQSFHFDERTKYTVTIERAFVCVNANGMRYYISLPLSDANDVQRAVVHKKAAPPEQNTFNPSRKKAVSGNKTVPCKCTFCGAKCKIPAGSGRITVTCSECGESFTAIS